MIPWKNVNEELPTDKEAKEMIKVLVYQDKEVYKAYWTTHCDDRGVDVCNAFWIDYSKHNCEMFPAESYEADIEPFEGLEYGGKITHWAKINIPKEIK